MKIQRDTTFISSFFYQPVYTLQGALLAIELLVRFNSEDHKLSAPTELVLKSLERPQIVALLMEQLAWAEQHAAWFRRAGVPLNLNVGEACARAIVQEPLLRRHLKALPFIHLEIAESYPALSSGKRNPVLSALRRDFTLWLDSFGSGNATLTPLFDGLFDYVKVDKTFFWQLVDGEHFTIVMPSLIRNVNRFCHGIIIEGVDTPAYFNAFSELPLAGVQGQLWPSRDDSQLDTLLDVPPEFR
ncbi:diguanylate phosphodiesterase [Chimaeribacter coloradensis]|uniref:Diguanylate phosphodiesterase n=1 Tax=Chimaeribacter coloradensis TaxID=2060068 RepID=A0A2N5EDE5_9GAMM|nr:EAL domain-containing protein [Chimaeribacter coloradensis]PLR40531.1 diguanylate phosphodiesterase [Chimaeribacter coloradensis]